MAMVGGQYGGWGYRQNLWVSAKTPETHKYRRYFVKNGTGAGMKVQSNQTALMTTATPATNSQPTTQRLYTLRLTAEQYEDLCTWLEEGWDLDWHSDESNLDFIRTMMNGDERADWRIRAMGTVNQFIGGDFDVA